MEVQSEPAIYAKAVSRSRVSDALTAVIRFGTAVVHRSRACTEFPGFALEFLGFFGTKKGEDAGYGINSIFSLSP
jgi:hypothetical protein